jgi:hypothetical protein
MDTPLMDKYNWDRLDGLGFSEDAKNTLKKACWKGYEAIGMKKKGGRMVPNCVPVDSKHAEKPSSTSEMTPNFLPEEPGEGDEKNPQMNESGVPIRMPRIPEIVKASNNNGNLAMRAAPNYAEINDFSDPFHSSEPNANMALTQLRAMREKIDIMLGMLYPDDNLPPWCATKITNAGTGLASVADYLKYGGELV